MGIKDGAKLTVVWFDGEIDTFIYNSISNLFINDGNEVFTTKQLITEEELEYCIKHVDDNFSVILDAGKPTIKKYELINN